MTSTRSDPAAGSRQHMLRLLRSELERHDASVARQGETLRPSCGRLAWSEPSEARCLVAKVIDHWPASARLELPWSSEEPLKVSCTCSDRGWWPGLGMAVRSGDRCAHTWAAVAQLIDLIEDQPDDPIAVEACRLDGAWRRTVLVLDEYLERIEHARGQASRRRITFRVGEGWYGLEVGLWEQKISRSSGRWTQGRSVDPDRLTIHYGPHLDPADEKVRASLRGAALDPEIVDSFDLLRAIQGHPRVFRMEDASHPVRVEKADLALHIDAVSAEQDPDSAGGLVLGARLGGHLLREIPKRRRTQGAGIAALVEEDRVLVAESEPEIVEFLLRLDERVTTVLPPAATAEVLGRLTQLGERIPLRVGPALSGPPRAADERPVLRLSAEDAGGLTVELRVRPWKGALHPPGAGPERRTIVDDDGGCFVDCERRLSAEVEAGGAVRDRLGLPEEPSWQWRLPSSDQALDVVAAAQKVAGESLASVEWASGRRRVRGTLGPAALRVQVEDRRDWFGVSGAATVDGIDIPLALILTALRSGHRYVAVGDGDWAEISDQLRQRLGLLDEVVHVRRDRLEIDPTGAPAVLEAAGEEVDLEVSRRFVELLSRIDAALALEPDPPAELQADLRPYQLAGYRWLSRLAAWGVGGCLADDMGLGKTVQTLAVLLERRATGPALVVAPTSVGFNWQRESARFAPDLKTVLYRSRDRRRWLERLDEIDVVVTSYALLQRDVAHLAEVSWGTFVLDEAQAVKNSRTKTAQAARRIEAEWRLALTGTPIENHLGELWSLYRILSPGLFGSWERFRELYAEPIERGADEERRQALARRLQPFLLRRTKGEVLKELPPRTEVELFADPSVAEKRLYDETRLRVLAELASPSADDQRFQVLAALTRLRQLACHPALVEGSWKKSSAKLDLFLETVAELREGGHRALVFSQFTRHLGLVAKALRELEIDFLYLDGGTPAKERARRVDEFQAGRGELFLISLKAGGTGLNLTGADYVVILDPWWNPAVEDQASDRAHRIGQDRPVTVYRLVSRGTIEEEILRLHASKRELVAGVLDGSDRAARLSTEELVGLIRGQE